MESRDAVDIHSSCALVPPPSPRKWPPRRILVGLLCERLRQHRVPGGGRGGHGAPGRAPCCVRAAAIMASPSLRRRVLFSAGRWRGGRSPRCLPALRVPGAAGKWWVWGGLSFFGVFFPFPPPFPQRFVRGCGRAKPGREQRFLPAHNMAGAPCGSGAGGAPAGPGRAGGRPAGRTKAARIMPAQPWLL